MTKRHVSQLLLCADRPVADNGRTAIESGLALRGSRAVTQRRGSDRGAAAVEFALVVPLLAALVFGIMEFGWIFNQQVSLSNAARESARYYAIGHEDGVTVDEAVAAGKLAAPTVDWAVSGAAITISPTCSDEGGQVDALATIPMPGLTGFFDAILGSTLTGRGSTICGG